MGLSFNTDIFFDSIGRLKLVTVGIGLLHLILLALSYVKDSRDQAFLAFVIIFFFLSLFWVVGVIFGLIVVNDSHTKFDIAYHAVACIVLLITSTFFFISIVKHGSGPPKFACRVLSLILGYGNGFVYGYLPWKLLKTT